MRLYTAPSSVQKSLFLAGGISGCPNWQAQMIDALKETSLIIFNPRRDKFDVNDADASVKQIEWEHYHLRKADAILFWFPAESVCPIALYELGAWSMTGKTLFLGVHQEYKRLSDIHVQTRLVRPEVAIRIAWDLRALAEQVTSWSKELES